MPASASVPGEAATEPKFIWGVLINMALRYALAVFSEYVSLKVSNEPTPAVIAALQRNNSQTPVVSLSSLGLQLLGLPSNGATASRESKDLGAPLKVADGQANYQGLHLALLAVDAQGQPLAFRPTSAGFTTGERFKVRVIATFDGLLSIDSINPSGIRRQLYPAQTDQVVSLKAGQEILLPLDPRQSFQFAGATGQEQLVVTLRHAQAIGPAASDRPVNRGDLPTGTNLVQEQTAGRFPLISQAIALRHGQP